MSEVREVVHDLQGNRSQCYYWRSLLHRLDGPARINYSGDKVVYEEWRVHGVLHRENGPAETFYNNGIPYCEGWRIYGTLHRTDGPAIICYYDDGSIREAHWYINDVHQKFVQYDHPSSIA